MENLDKDKKSVVAGSTIDLLTRLLALRKKNQQTNAKLDELKKKTGELLHPDHKTSTKKP